MFVCFKDTYLKVRVSDRRTKWGVPEEEMIGLFSEGTFRHILCACTYSGWDHPSRRLLAGCGVKPPFEHLPFPYALPRKVLCSRPVPTGSHSAN